MGKAFTFDVFRRIFFNGTNRVILQWASGVFTFQLTIDGTMFSITKDMVLVIIQGRWQCIDSNRSVVEEGPFEAWNHQTTLAN